MKFKFRYDSVIAIKDVFIKEMQKEIQKIDFKIEEKKQLKREMETEYFESSKMLTLGKMRSDEIVQLKSYQVYVQRKLLDIEYDISKLLENREDRVKDLIAKNKEMKILEKLKEKHFRKFKTEERQLDNKEMNEFAIQSFSRGDK